MSPLKAHASTPSSTPHGKRSSAQLDEVCKGKVGVTEKGLIDTTCEGKNRWHADFKAEVLRWLDISVIAFAHQHPADWASVLENVNSRWEYVGSNGQGVSSKCLERLGAHVLKAERHRLHAAWQKAGSNPRDKPPPSVQSGQWARLVTHFQSDAAQVKSEQMSLARAKVKNVNTTGRKGMAPIVSRLVRPILCSIMVIYISFLRFS